VEDFPKILLRSFENVSLLYDTTGVNAKSKADVVVCLV